MSHLLYAVKRQLTIRFTSLKTIQTGLCMLMSLSIHLHGLHRDDQYGQTWHLSTQLRCGERTGRRLMWSTTLLLPALLSDSQVSISIITHDLWWTISGQVKAHVVHKWGLAQSPICDCGQWQTMNHILDTCPLTKSEGGLNLLQEVTQTYGWNLQWLQHSRNK